MRLNDRAKRSRTLRATLTVVLLLGTAGATGGVDAPTESIRLALFNIRELSTNKILQTDEAGVGRNPQLRAAASIIQEIRPDILVINEIDHLLPAGERGLEWNARRFADAYLASGPMPIDYAFAFAAPNNTGRLTGIDFDDDGQISTPTDSGARTFGNDCFGYGSYPGQYSMAVLSKLPLRSAEARTFQRFLWKDLEGHHMPPGHLTSEATEIFRLSSKSHWDLPVEVERGTLHLLISHPTPAGFDGEEDKNGRRNFDEIKFWAQYLDREAALYDDQGQRGGYASDDPLVLMGDLNASPDSRQSHYDGRVAISQLLDHPLVQDPGSQLTSAGALAAAGPDVAPGAPDYRERSTAQFGDGVRIDYILPSVGLRVVGGGVYWPDAASDPEGAARAELASDHRLVWLDIELPSGLETESDRP